VVHIEEPSGPRSVPLTGLYRLPAETPEQETALAPGALITGVELPLLGFSRQSAYRKVRDRASYAFAVASVAAAVEVEGGTVRDVRLALGAVAPMPWRARRVEAELVGRPAVPGEFRQAIEAELAAARPLRDNAYKVPLVRNLVVRVLSDLVERHGGRR